MKAQLAELKVLILYNRPQGGQESELGVMREVDALEKALTQLQIPWEARGVSELDEVVLVLDEYPWHIVFNLVESFGKEVLRACLVPCLCRAKGFAVTGSSTPALILTTDKVLAKTILRANGIPTPPWKAIRSECEIDLIEGLSPPIIIKPILSDGSEGIDMMHSVIPKHRLRESSTISFVKGLLREFPYGLLAEEFVGEREVSITVLEGKDGPVAIEMAEIDLSQLPDDCPKILDYQSKWDEGSYSYHHTPRIIPARVREDMRERIMKEAVRCFQIFGCNDYLRVDVRLTEKNFWVIDVNTNPDISLDAGLAGTLIASGIPYEEFIGRVIENAKRRSKDLH